MSITTFFFENAILSKGNVKNAGLMLRGGYERLMAYKQANKQI